MLKKFLRNTSGNVMITTALMAMPLALSIGVGIDMAEAYRAKANYQAAVDAAALAAAKVLSKTGDSAAAEEYGADVFEANIGNLSNSVGSINIDTGNGDCSSRGVVATANLRHRMFYDGLHQYFSDQGDADHMNIQVSSTVQCGNDTVEIALVLDNSGSMGSNGKLSTLKDASKRLVQSLHQQMHGSSKSDPIKFGLVPFSGMVNVGSNNRNASWMDTQGRSSIYHEHLDWANDPNAVKVGGVWKTTSGQTLSRFTLYDQMNINWDGCVEQRPYPHHTLDSTPSSADPDTLFVPSFAPDTPDNYSGQREETRSTSSGPAVTAWCTRWNRRNSSRCSRWSDGYRGSYHPVEGYANRYGGDYDNRGRWIGGGSSSSVTYGNIIQEQTYQNNYLADAHNMPSGGQNELHPDVTGSGTDQYKRQRWTWKYFNNPNPRDVNNNRNGLPSVIGSTGGPNSFCKSAPILPMTTNLGHAVSGIETMQARGSTNISQGVGWGWRLLSAAEPFTGGRPKSVADNKKIMIVMTDGNNTYYPIDYFYNGYAKMNPAYYSAYGFNGGPYADNPTNKRLFDGFGGIANPTDNFNTYRQAMDEHLVETCTNAKNDGIQIYSIAFDVPNGSSVKTMLQQCASTGAGGAPLYYDAQNNAALIGAFESIAEKIAELSITK